MIGPSTNFLKLRVEPLASLSFYFPESSAQIFFHPECLHRDNFTSKLSPKWKKNERKAPKAYEKAKPNSIYSNVCCESES